MKIAAVDNETGALNILIRAIEEALPRAEVRGFRKASALLDEVQTGSFLPDVAFLDIEMPGMSGLELAKRLKDVCGDSNVVFVTGFTEYALEAFKVHACGYMLKPAGPEKVLEAMEHLHRPATPAGSGKRVRVQCFGSFEVFVDGKPVAFSRQRSKELLAYLISRRGAVSTTAEIATALWEDGYYDSSRNAQIHNYLSALIKTLDALGEKDILYRQYNGYAVDVSRVDCDYYRCFDDDPAAINAYYGEFMSQYSWAEFVAGTLTHKSLK